MNDLTPQEANVVVLTILIQLLERQEFASPEINKQAQAELRKAKKRQLEILNANRNFAQKVAK